MLDATYSFRFDGFAMRNGVVPAYIVGVGRFQLTPDGGLVGAHHSSTTLLRVPEDAPAQQLQAEYRLHGSYSLEAPLGMAAEITFARQGRIEGVEQGAFDMVGRFRLVGVGTYDRLWLISTQGEIPAFGLSADEVIHGEAVRMVSV